MEVAGLSTEIVKIEKVAVGRDWVLERLVVHLEFAEQLWVIQFWFANEVVSPLAYFLSAFRLDVLSQCLQGSLNYLRGNLCDRRNLFVVGALRKQPEVLNAMVEH